MKLIAQWLWFGAASLWCVNALTAATFNIPTPATLSLKATQGGMRVTYRGATNFQYLLQTSSNLQSWSLLSSNIATSTNVAFLDSQTNRPARFYKATSLPTPFLYQGTNFGSENGAFILLVRTNNSTVFMGVNLTLGHKRGEYTTALTVDNSNMTCGTFILGAPGCLSLTSSNISGKFTNTQSHIAGTVTGKQKANVGAYNGLAGIYGGTVSQPHDGPALLLLCPDGSMAFYRGDGNRIDGAVDVMTPQGNVDAYLSGSVIMHVTGSFDTINRVFSLIIHETDGLISTLTMTMSEPLF
jgi:hypothetical protein